MGRMLPYKGACDPRFLFQGSGYVESSNSRCRKLVSLKSVKLAQIPWLMRRVTVAIHKVRSVGISKEYLGMVRKLQGSQLLTVSLATF